MYHFHLEFSGLMGRAGTKLSQAGQSAPRIDWPSSMAECARYTIKAAVISITATGDMGCLGGLPRSLRGYEPGRGAPGGDGVGVRTDHDFALRAEVSSSPIVN